MEIKIKQVHTTKDLIISAIVLAAGIGLYFVNAGIGIVAALCGVIMLLFYKCGHKREGENTILKKRALELEDSCRESLLGFLKGENVEPHIHTASMGKIIRLELYFNASAAIAYSQLFDFNNYTYESATEIVELRGDKALLLIKKIQENGS